MQYSKQDGVVFIWTHEKYVTLQNILPNEKIIIPFVMYSDLCLVKYNTHVQWS